jgi:hypothetical protein
MKPKPSFDPDFDGNPHRRFSPVRSIVLLLIFVALSGVAWAVCPTRTPQQPWRVPPGLCRDGGIPQLPGQAPQWMAPLGRWRDPFVLMAPAEIDPKMIVPAPADVDQAMAIRPETLGGGPKRMAPAVGATIPATGLRPIPRPYGWHPPDVAPPSITPPARPR